MAETTPTAEQLRAIRVAGSAAVRAGAGSGKTTVLAHRFLHLLRPGPDGHPPVEAVGEILAITFTDKAAAEMRKKIRELVALEIAGAPGAERRRWERVRAELLGAQISTIHAFCARVVRENPLEADVDPQATILDEHESPAYLEALVEQELAGRLRAGDTAVAELVLRHGLTGGRIGGAVGLCVRMLAWLGTAGRDAGWLATAMARQEATAPEAVRAMEAAAERIVGAIRGVLSASDSPKLARLRDEWPTWEATLVGLSAAMPTAEFSRLRDLCRLLVAARLTSEVSADLAFKDNRLSGVLADQYGFLASLPVARRLSILLGEIADAVATRKRADAVLTFDDLIVEARTLLASRPALRERYAGRFRAVLVDEFQDTDAVQAAVIRELAAPGVPLFIVGDEKQSIYGFRGADVAVFHRAREQLGCELPLGTNFRSQPAVLEFVNALATHIFRVPDDALDRARWTVFDPSQRLVAERSQEWARPGVGLVTFAGEHARRSLRAAEARELEARVLAAAIAELHERPDRPVAYGDVAVLFRTLAQVKAYEYALRRQAIPYYVVKGRGFFQCQEVRDVVSLLAAVADPEDGVALAAVLRSPFFAIDDQMLWRLAWPANAERPSLTRRFRRSDDFGDLPDDAPELERIRTLLQRLRRLRSRATIAELIEEALAATDFEAVCLTQFQGGQKVANVRKLIELARDFERRRLSGLGDFVRTVRGLTEGEPREPEAQLVGEQDDVVRLMTIHQAKGLEFPVVILVDLGRRLESEWPTTVLDEELGVITVPVTGSGSHPLRSARLEDHRARDRDRTRAEHARLFYVACTRARDFLLLLEGKGDQKYLERGEGDAHIWCHQVWDLLGRERIREFVQGSAPETILPIPGGGEVLVERAERYLETRRRTLPEPSPPDEAPASDAERDAVSRVLGFAPPAPSDVVTSPTALADFRRCPREYWYRHVLGLPERGASGIRAALRGAAAHGVLETLDLETASEPEIARQLAARPEALRLEPAELAALGADLTMAAAALRAEIAAGLALVGREIPFVLGLPATRPHVFVHGRIDLLARRGGTSVVRDYKYAAPSAVGVARYAAQLAAYDLALRAAGAPRVEAELLFLRGGPVVRALPPIDAAAEEHATVAAAVALGAATASGERADFPRRPPAPAACEALGCGYVRRCWGPEAFTRTDAAPRTGSDAS